MEKKPGRPKGYKAPDPHNNRVTINLTAAEFKLFLDGSKAAGLTQQKFGRKALVEYSTNKIRRAKCKLANT